MHRTNGRAHSETLSTTYYCTEPLLQYRISSSGWMTTAMLRIHPIVTSTPNHATSRASTPNIDESTHHIATSTSNHVISLASTPAIEVPDVDPSMAKTRVVRRKRELLDGRCNRDLMYIKSMVDALATQTGRDSIQKRIANMLASAKSYIDNTGTHPIKIGRSDYIYFQAHCDIHDGRHQFHFNVHKVREFLRLWPDTTLIHDVVMHKLHTSHLCWQYTNKRCVGQGHALIETSAQNSRRSSHLSGNVLCDCAPQFPRAGKMVIMSRFSMRQGCISHGATLLLLFCVCGRLI